MLHSSGTSARKPYQDSFLSARAFLTDIRFVAILAAALVLRVYWMIGHVHVIDNDGAEYARIAENLIKGNGYVGLMGELELVFPILFPSIIAAFTIVTKNPEISGRVISVIAGTALVIPMSLLTARLYGRRAALCCAILVAAHPILVHLSGSVLSEAPYMAFWVCGLLFAVKALQGWRPMDGFLSGIFFGIAFMVRPESLVDPAILVFMIWVSWFTQKKQKSSSVLLSVCVVGGFLVASSPQIAVQYMHTGKISFGGKAPVNLMIVDRIRSGMPPEEAMYGVDENLVENGALLNPNAVITQTDAGALVRPFMWNAKTFAKGLWGYFTRNLPFAGIVLILLGIVGFLKRNWTRDMALYEGLLVLFACGAFLVMLGAPVIRLRYAAQFLPFFIIWASMGIDSLLNLSEKFKLSSKRLPRLAVLSLLCIAGLILVSGFGSVAQALVPRSPRWEKAGLWLKEHSNESTKVMSSGTIIPYYAGSIWMPLPYATSETAVNYIQSKQPDYIVLTERDAINRPFAEKWFSGGFPDSHATRVYSDNDDSKDRVVIFKMNR